MKLSSLLADPQNRVGAHKDLVRFCGSVTRAVVLQNFIFWSGKSKRAGSVFYGTIPEFADNLALSSKTFRTARDWAESKGYISHRVGHAPGSSFKTTWYMVNTETIQSAFDAFYAEFHAKDDLDFTTSDDGNPFASPDMTPSAHSGRPICPNGQSHLPPGADPSALSGDSLKQIDPQIDPQIENTTQRASFESLEPKTSEELEINEQVVKNARKIPADEIEYEFQNFVMHYADGRTKTETQWLGLWRKWDAGYQPPKAAKAPKGFGVTQADKDDADMLAVVRHFKRGIGYHQLSKSEKDKLATAVQFGLITQAEIDERRAK